MFRFRNFPNAAIAVEVDVVTATMITFLDTESPSGHREGKYIYFNIDNRSDDPIADAAGDALDFVNRFEGYVINVEDRPADLLVGGSRRVC